LGGYADRTTGATGTLDGLEVHCVAFIAGADAFLLVVADLVCVNGDLAGAVADAVGQRVGVPPGQVWTTATHTHAGPDVNCGPGRRTTPAPWLDLVPAAAAAAAEQAVAAARTATVTWHTGLLNGVGATRSVVNAPPTVPVDVLAVRHGLDSGHPELAGVLAVLPIHPTVLPAANTLVSGDLAAGVRRHLTTRLRAGESRPWVVVATGCAGDISTRSTRSAQTPAELDRLSALAAEQVAATLTAPPVRTADPQGSLRVARRRLRLPLRVEDPEPARTPAADGSPLAARIAYTMAQGRRVAAERAARHPDGTVELVVAAADLAGLRLLALGAEPYLRVRDLAARPAVVLGYANGYAGYLPDDSGFDQASYESLSSPFGPGAAQVAVRAAEAALNHPDREEST
jgi:hypothetical protein